MNRAVLLAALPLALGCKSPLEPISGPAQPTDSAHGRSITFAGLSSGGTLAIQYHSQSCFLRYEASFMFVGTGDGVALRGTVRVPFLRGPVQSAALKDRFLTSTELRQLDKMLNLYRTSSTEGGARARSTSLRA